MPTKCAFNLSRATPIYYAGEQISGRIVVQTTKRLALTAIKLKLLGEARVEWTERNKLPHTIEHNDCTQADNHCVRYCGTQTYLKECLPLDERITLEAAGCYERSFTFALPQQCVASCKEAYGEVAYKLQLVLQRESTFNKIYQQRVVVRNRVDLNALPASVSEPYSIKSDGGLELALHCRGFVPGQQLPYRLQSDSYALPARKIVIALHELCQYSALEPTHTTKSVTKVLAQQKNDTASSQSFRVDGCLRLPLHVQIGIPSPDCLLHISYYLAVVVLGGKSKILEKLYVPLSMGSTPLQQSAGSVSAPNETHMHCYDNLVAQQHGAVIPEPVGKEPLSSMESLGGMNVAKYYDRRTLIPLL